MMRDRLSTWTVLGFVAAAAVSGCAQDDDYDLAVASTTAALETSRGSGTSRVAFESADDKGCVDPLTAAQSAVARPMIGMVPEGCAVKTVQGATVHVEFDNCTGPFGRMHLHGGIDATFTGCSDGKANVSVQDSGNLTRNGRAMDYQASAVVVQQDTGRDVTWNATWNSTTKRGRHIEHTSNLDILIDRATSCLDIVGTTNGHVDGRTFGSQIDGLQVCPDKCPSSGTILVHRQKWRGEKTLVIRFDGTDQAKVTGSDGREFTVPLECNEG